MSSSTFAFALGYAFLFLSIFTFTGEALCESHKTLTFEEGWPVLQAAIDKLVDSLEGVRPHGFTSEEYMTLYTTVYDICHCPNLVGPECQRLYDEYKKTFEDYISSHVLPSLREKKDEDLLQELMKRWKNHQTMTRWLSRFFNYINRYFIQKRKLPTLPAISHLTFYELVYGELQDRVRDSVIYMIDQEREGEEIDHWLVKSVLNIYVAMGEESMKYCVKDFEEAMVNDTAAFYSGKASVWITKKSYKDYILKVMLNVEECLKQEMDRVSCYSQVTNQKGSQKAMEHELQPVCASKVEENKQLDGESAQTE